jgi:hypothetical protein
MKDCRNVFATHSLITTGPMFFILRRMSSMQSLNSGDFSSIGWGTINSEYVSCYS